jgi:hypothetical protein
MITSLNIINILVFVMKTSVFSAQYRLILNIDFDEF